MSPPRNPPWTVFGSALRGRSLFVAVVAAGFAQAVTVTTIFNDLSNHNSSAIGIGPLGQSGDFKFNHTGLFVRGETNAYDPGSGAIFVGTRADGSSLIDPASLKTRPTLKPKIPPSR